MFVNATDWRNFVWVTTANILADTAIVRLLKKLAIIAKINGIQR